MEVYCKSKRKKELKRKKGVEIEILENDSPNISQHETTGNHVVHVSLRNKKTKNLLINKHKNINGSILTDKYIPEEVLIEILSHADSKSLLNCQLVCQYWKIIIQSRVWHKKAEQTTQQSLIFDKRILWRNYYCLSNKMPFNKNLIKNHSGQEGLNIHWELPPLKSIQWTVENPIALPLLSDDLSFGEEKVCFVTSGTMTWKYQIVDLIKEGFSSYLLDHLQPTIKVSEWYCSSNTPAKYICDIELLKGNGEKKMIFCSLENYDESSYDMYDHHTFSRIIKCEEQNHWHKYEHEFKNYGQGLRKIKFIHGGRKINHYGEGTQNDSGAKMTRACVKLNVPSLDYNYIKILSSHC